MFLLDSREWNECAPIRTLMARGSLSWVCGAGFSLLLFSFSSFTMWHMQWLSLSPCCVQLLKLKPGEGGIYMCQPSHGVGLKGCLVCRKRKSSLSVSACQVFSGLGPASPGNFRNSSPSKIFCSQQGKCNKSHKRAKKEKTKISCWNQTSWNGNKSRASWKEQHQYL